MYELWGEGTCYEELRDSIERFPDSRKLPFLDSDSTFRISVETFGKALTFDEQRERINSFTYIPFEGADIDIRVVRDGRGPDCNVWSNFKQYGLPMPVALLRMDNNLPPWRSGLKKIFDAIICDPPYGVRAGGRKSGGRKILRGTVDPYTVPDDTSTGAYSLVECVHDLFHLAARMLVMKGRHVFFFPVLRDENGSEVKFPEHPCFKLVAVSEQILSSRHSRVLLTMVKVEPYSEVIEEAVRLMHLEFRENHLKWLEEGNIHSSVFKPSDSSEVHTDTKTFKDPKPKYRWKYV